jgi:uncharacterized protein (DUF1015 family)
VWRATPEESSLLSDAFRQVLRFYIADGHHRAAAASRARRESVEWGSKDAPSASFLAVAFPASQLRILAYNRVVKDLKGRRPDAFLAELATRYPELDVPGPGRFGAYVGGQWHEFELPASPGEGPKAQLDVERLQHAVLAPLLGIGDPRTDTRLDFVGGHASRVKMQAMVEGGKAAVAFALTPATVEELMNVSDAGDLMPPKSTWFEPKLRDALLIHEI